MIESPIQLKDDLAHSLGSASRCRDDVLGNPCYSFAERPSTISVLGGSDGMDYTHEFLSDAKVVMDELDQGGQVGGGGGGSVDDSLKGVAIMVHAHSKHGGISRKGRDDDPFVSKS